MYSFERVGLTLLNGLYTLCVLLTGFSTHFWQSKLDPNPAETQGCLRVIDVWVNIRAIYSAIFFWSSNKLVRI